MRYKFNPDEHIGEIHNYLKVLSFDPQPINRRWYCQCECKCGNIIRVRYDNIISGNTMSCGCYHRQKTSELTAERNRTHNDSNSRLYHIWQRMKARCYYTKNNRYYRYGARGISVCDKWHYSYEAFRDWALLNEYRDDLSIDRIDNDGNYCPENCRWANKKMQDSNKSTNVYLTYISGKNTDYPRYYTYTLSFWSDIIGISRAALIYRLSHRRFTKKSINEILTTDSKGNYLILYLSPEDLEYNQPEKFNISIHD